MSTSDFISPVKRDRIRRAQQLQLKRDMRASLPILNKDEIRRYRLPYHKAIFIELHEHGYTSSEEFLKQLIQYQEELREKHGPEAAVSLRPRLLESKEQLNLLYNGLKAAESAHYIDDIGSEIGEFVKLGVIFGLGSEDWWWLGEQLLIQAVNIMLDAEKAKEELTLSRQAAMGKIWNATQELGYKQSSVFVESCVLLYRALLHQAREILKDDPLKASRICGIAKNRAIDAGDSIGEADALMLQGLCEIDAGDASSAVISFSKVLILYGRNDIKEGICETRINTALAYLKIGKFSETLNQLELLLDYAEKNNLQYYVAQAHRFLGEYYLNQGMPHLATPLLIKALHIFHDLDDILNREQARNLAAISAGQELVPKYIELILKSGTRSPKGADYLIKLINWKDTRELFWTGDELSIGSNISFEQSLLSLSKSQDRSIIRSQDEFGSLSEKSN